MSLKATDAPPSRSESMAPVAKAILDLTDLLALISKGISRAKPWERQLASELVEVDRRLQVLRMTIVMERDDNEILAAAERLRLGCRDASMSLRGSRAGATTQAALRLAADLAEGIVQALRQLVPLSSIQTATDQVEHDALGTQA